mmetsp:Transcript_13826/g.24292  ORF Transcript_13826/g.24292 Transcript_13826/m.24292 type:complete len:281 (+) Transcript_13826:778-1620(+)
MSKENIVKSLVASTVNICPRARELGLGIVLRLVTTQSDWQIMGFSLASHTKSPHRSSRGDSVELSVGSLLFELVGRGVGIRVGSFVGSLLGERVGRGVGIGVGSFVGSLLGERVGLGVGSGVGSGVGVGVGKGVGSGVGSRVGLGVGAVVGKGVGTVGSRVGTGVGKGVGSGVGAVVSSGVGKGVGSGVGLEVGKDVGSGVGFCVGSGPNKISTSAYLELGLSLISCTVIANSLQGKVKVLVRPSPTFPARELCPFFTSVIVTRLLLKLINQTEGPPDSI